MSKRLIISLKKKVLDIRCSCQVFSERGNSTNVDGLPRDIYSANIGIEILKLSNLSTVDLSYKIEGGEDYIGHSAYAKYSIKF